MRCDQDAAEWQTQCRALEARVAELEAEAKQRDRLLAKASRRAESHARSIADALHSRCHPDLECPCCAKVTAALKGPSTWGHIYKDKKI